MGPLRQAVETFFARQSWTYDADGSMLRTVVRNGDMSLLLAAVVVEDVGQLVVYSIHDDIIPEDQRAAVAELANRANVQITVGNLEIDLDAGQVRFRTGLAVGASPVTNEMVERTFFDNAGSAFTYFPLVNPVATGTTTPTEALAALA